MNCSEKGCVFPPGPDGLCNHHRRMFQPATSPPSSRLHAVCAYCHEAFYYRPKRRSGFNLATPHQFCCRRHASLSLWRRRKKKLPGPERLKWLYTVKHLSIPKIAALYGCANSSVQYALSHSGVQMRPHTSTQTCKKCNAPAMKMAHAKQDKHGRRILWGTLCLLHWRELCNERRRRYLKKG